MPPTRNGAHVAIAGLLFTFVVLANASGGTKNPVDRAVEFFRNVYTGVEMQPEEWLTKGTREAPLFMAFGGLSAMIKQTSEKAAQRGGFKTVIVRKSSRTQSGYNATIEVVFEDPLKGRNRSTAGTLEDEIWNVRITKESGRWKIAL